jgi:bifunctional UDP-N-acetylglucosamine pyrophosphorylase/glucosamine-1-phosphate N-acetyltransferase
MRCSRQRSALKVFDGHVLILYGDVPFVTAATMQRDDRSAAQRGGCPAVVVLGFEPEDALQYGRIVATGDGVIERWSS